MRKKYLKFLVVLIPFLVIFPLIFTNKEINNKGISKVERLLSKPEGIQAYTLNGEKTNITFNELINGYTINKITCKNGSVATYNKEDNSISLSNIHMPDYCTIDFTNAPAFYGKLLADNPTIKTRTDFSTTYTETNTGTLYKATESIANSPAKDVYYFAGDAKNNWVKFGGYYWRIIRTNHDSSIRLLYSGKSPDTTEGYIEKVQYFSSSHDNPISVGYMYGTAGSLDNNRQNSNDSRVKEYIDKWYSDNLSIYNNYISYDAVYCNDRELINGSIYSETNYTYYAGYNRLFVNKSPVYNCTNKKDAFSGSNSEAKLTYPIGLMTADEVAFAGGVNYTNANVYYTLNSKGNAITGEKSWWLLTPKFFDATYMESAMYVINSENYIGRLEQLGVTWYASLRPVISIKSDTLYSKGNGSPENPYEIVYN